MDDQENEQKVHNKILCKSVKHTERQTEVKGKKYGFLYSVYTYLITNLRMFEDAHLMSLFGCCALFATPHTEYHWAAISSLSLALDCRQYNKIYILHITYHTKKAGLFTLITSYHLFSLSLWVHRHRGRVHCSPNLTWLG